MNFVIIVAMLVLKASTSTHLVAIVGNHQYVLVTICLPTSLIGLMKSNAHFMKGYPKSIMMNLTMFEVKVIYLLTIIIDFTILVNVLIKCGPPIFGIHKISRGDVH
jgi:hypothetical protein